MRPEHRISPDLSKLPITIYVGYPWPKRTAGRKVNDSVWDFVRCKVSTAADAVAKIQANRAAPKLPIRINRLRARHGGSVLEVLVRRIGESDIVIFDITGLNENVLVEIGMALATKGTAGSVFILQKSDSKGQPLTAAAHPSDLNGYFFTRYHDNVLRGRSSYRLIEAQGFLAAPAIKVDRRRTRARHLARCAGHPDR